jgi:hypothetical protein
MPKTRFYSDPQINCLAALLVSLIPFVLAIISYRASLGALL